jgi:type II secretory pathway component GspD/PulD (secretin)
MTVRTRCLGLGVLVCGLAVCRAAEPQRPPGPDKQTELDKQRLEVLRALEQFREAEARLRQAEKRLRDLEGKAAPQAADEGRTEMKVFALKYTDASALARVLAEAFGKDRLVLGVDDRTNSLIVRGRRLDIGEAEALINILDREGKPVPGPDDVFVYRLKNAEAVELSKVLTQVFGQGRAHIVADPVTNALLVRARDDDRRQIERLIQELDQPARPPRPDRPIK